MSENSEIFERGSRNEVIGLTKAIAAAFKAAYPSSDLRGGEGVDDAPSEANFKTKASKQGLTGIGGWIVIVAGGHRVCGPQDRQ